MALKKPMIIPSIFFSLRYKVAYISGYCGCVSTAVSGNISDINVHHVCFPLLCKGESKHAPLALLQHSIPNPDTTWRGLRILLEGSMARLRLVSCLGIRGPRMSHSRQLPWRQGTVMILELLRCGCWCCFLFRCV